MTIPRNYEIYLKQHVTGNAVDDYETVQFENARNYRDAVKKAKEYSTHIGELKVNGFTFSKRDNGWQQPLDEGLACVAVVCYLKTDMTDYDIVFDECFIDGKSQGKLYYN